MKNIKDIKYKLNLEKDYKLYDKIAGNNTNYKEIFIEGVNKLQNHFTYPEIYSILLKYIQEHRKINVNYLLKKKIITIKINKLFLTTTWRLQELYKKYFINTKIDNFLSIGNINNFIESLEFYDHKINNITVINIKYGGMNPIQIGLVGDYNVFTKLQNRNSTWINDKILKRIIINNIYELNSIENLQKYDLIDFTYLNWNIDPNLFNLKEYTLRANNELYLINNILFIFKNLNIGGNTILNINCIEKKIQADIYLIFKKYFKEVELFFPEITYYTNLNHYVYLIGKGFRGVPEKDITELQKIKTKILKIYGINNENFNIYDENMRSKFNIKKELKTINNIKFVNGFLDTNLNNSEDYLLYKDIIKIVSLRNHHLEIVYENFSIYTDLILEYIKDNKSKFIETYSINEFKPSNEQITNSIYYLKKLDIEVEKETEDLQKSKISALTSIYCLAQPIFFRFKTSHQFYIIPHKKKRSVQKKTSLSINSKNLNKKKKKSKNYKIRQKINIFKYIRKAKYSTKKSINSYKFDNIIELFKTKNKEYFSYDVSLKKRLLKSNKKIFYSDLYYISILNSYNTNYITYIESELKNQKTISKDTIKNKIKTIKKHFMYDEENTNDVLSISELIKKSLLNDKVDFHWSVIYELLKNINLTKINKQINSYHFTNKKNFESEIDVLEFYIKNISNKTKIFSKRIKNNTDIQIQDIIDEITNVENSLKPNIIFDTHDYTDSDILSVKTKFVNFIQGILHLENNGHFIIKLSIPIKSKVILNIIYLFYQFFKEVYIIKPILYSSNSSFYLVGKNLKYINYEVICDLIEVLNVEFNSMIDINYDLYPEAFVSQFNHVYSVLVDNYVEYIDKIIYYFQHYNNLDKRFKGIAKEYIKEKRLEWLNKYEIGTNKRNKNK